MKITNCLNPHRIYNKYLGQYQWVPCGKCSSCLNIRQHSWIDRMKQESMLHKYTVMFTLTYDNDCLPRYIKHGDVMVSAPRKYRYFNTNGYLVEKTICDADCFPISEFDLSYKRDQRYFDCYDDFSYVSVVDLQKFIKKLRYYAHELFKKNKKAETSPESYRIRYYIVSELGPYRHRAHSHGILWFDSSELASKIKEYIIKAWKLCDESCIDVQFADAESAKYVAKYCTKFGSLPSVFRHYALRPFAIFSKRPFIGHDRLSKNQIKSIILETKLCTAKYDLKQRKSILAPHERSFELRYFPRCYGYSQIDFRTRVRLYSCVSRWKTFSFGSFKNYVRSLALDNCRNNEDSFLFLWIIERTRNFFPDNFDDALDSILYRIYCLSLHMMFLCLFFEIDMLLYCKKIDEYYVAKDHDKLQSQYIYMQSYTENWKNNNPDDLRLLFPDQVPDYLDNLKLCDEYKGLASLTEKMIIDMEKNKQRKEYKRIREKRLNPRIY